MSTLPKLHADLLLLHAPAVFEFRGRRDIYFPFLGTSGDVPITPLYEYFPVGFKTLQRFLGARGHGVKILNLSSLFLQYPDLRLEDVAEAIDAKVIGIDLHWMVHVQGALAVAERLHALRPDIPIVFGGISSTYFAQELVRYPFIAMVMRGYDTHAPMDVLLETVREGGDLARVPNLLWKDRSGAVVDNGFVHKPATLACGIDWTTAPQPAASNKLPILEMLSTQNAGCAYNCGWCGGSRDAFRRVFQKQRTMVRKPVDEISFEMGSVQEVPGRDRYHFYAVGSYNETKEGMDFFLDRVAESGLKSISYEQFHLTPADVLAKMARSNPRTSITLSPESHDPHVARLAGRGVYTNDEMEAWIPRALDAGIQQIDIWYFVGMPEQDARSVDGTVEYCERLLAKFPRARVNPMICPMIPFLDPASTFFEEPERHGYEVFHRSAEQHRRGMERASIVNRINYQTKWLSRQQLVEVGFDAVRRLMVAKGDAGRLPRSWVESYAAKVDDAIAFNRVVLAADDLAAPDDRRRALAELGDEILRRNDALFRGGVANQAFPLAREIGGRWFDELGWTPSELAARSAKAA